VADAAAQDAADDAACKEKEEETSWQRRGGGTVRNGCGVRWPRSSRRRPARGLDEESAAARERAFIEATRAGP
jgi:hypothetical protein